MSKSNLSSKTIERLGEYAHKQWHRAKAIESCFDEMKATYGKCEEFSTSSAINHQITKNGTPHTDSMLDYHLTCIRRRAMSDDYGGLSEDSEATVINLNGEPLNDAAPSNFDQTLYKVQINEGRKEVLGRTLISVQFPGEAPNYLCLNEDEAYPAAIYMDSNANTAYLVCEQDGIVSAYELETFAMLSVIGKSTAVENGLFTMFRQKHYTQLGEMIDTILANLYIDGTPDIGQAQLPSWLFTLGLDKQVSTPKEEVAEPKDTIPAEAYAVSAASPDMQNSYAQTS